MVARQREFTPPYNHPAPLTISWARTEPSKQETFGHHFQSSGGRFRRCTTDSVSTRKGLQNAISSARIYLSHKTPVDYQNRSSDIPQGGLPHLHIAKTGRLISSGLLYLWPKESPRLTLFRFVPVFWEPLSGASESRPIFYTRKSPEDIMLNGTLKNIYKSNLQYAYMQKVPVLETSG